MTSNRSTRWLAARWAMAVVVVCCLGTASRGGDHHWGPYIQGHTPAFVPNNPRHGFNQTYWRRWPDAPWDRQRPAKQPTRAEELPPPAQEDDEDYPPPPPFREELHESDISPDLDVPEHELQPVPGVRPTPPPGLTQPDAFEPSPPTQSPSDELPPPGEMHEAEPEPELAPLEDEPATQPGTTPIQRPRLPTPPTELDTQPKLQRATPPPSRRDATPVQARAQRAHNGSPAAEEAVFRGQGRIEAHPPAASREPARNDAQRTRPSSIPAQPQRDAAPEWEAPQQELELFQPGAPRARPAATPRDSAVKPASYQAGRLTVAPTMRMATPSVAAANVATPSVAPPAQENAQAIHRAAAPPRAKPAAKPSLLLTNPLRESGDESYAGVAQETAGGNPLRP